MCDVILVTADPEFAVIEGHLQVSIVSGEEQHIFRLTKFRARGAALRCLRTLDEDMPRPCEIRPFGKHPGHD